MTGENIVYQTNFNIIANTNNANGLKPSRTTVFDYAKANGKYHWVIVVPLTTNSHCTGIVGEIYIWLSWRLRSRKLASEGTRCTRVSKRNTWSSFSRFWKLIKLVSRIHDTLEQPEWITSFPCRIRTLYKYIWSTYSMEIFIWFSMEIQLLNNNSIQLINIFFRDQRIKRDEENWKGKGASRTGKENIS